MQVRQLSCLCLYLVNGCSVNGSDMVMHRLCPAYVLAAQQAVTGEIQATCTFTQQIRPASMFDQRQEAGAKFKLLDGVNIRRSQQGGPSFR